MRKIIISAVITMIILITGLSFIEIEENLQLEEENSIIYALDKIPNSVKDVSLLSTREKDIITATSKGLVEKNSNGDIEPCLASEVNIKEDGIEYQFKIKNDIYWSDGNLITPDDIVDFFREILKEESDENIKELLNIYGAREYREGEVSFDSGVAINATEDTVIIRLNSKDDKFLEELTKPQYRVRKFLIMWEDLEANYKDIPYAGDYFISKINEEGMELKVNKYNVKDAKVEAIKLVEDKNVELAMAAYDIGERDIVVNPPKSELNRLAGEEKLITLPSDKAKYIYINEDLPLKTRRTIYNNYNKALEEYSISNSYFVESAEGSYFREDKDDLTKLQARKVSSNKDNGKLPEIITLLAEDTIDNRSICKHIQNWYKENTGTTIRYSLVTKEEYENKELRKRYDVVIVDSVANRKHEEKYYSDLEEWFNERQKNMINEEKYSELENDLFSNYTFLPLVFENINVAISDRVKEIDFDWYGNLKFSDINKISDTEKNDES